MESCYEYLGCDKKDCIMYKEKSDQRCWEVEGTLCNHPGIQFMREELEGKKKEHSCINSACIYYKAAHGQSV